MNNSSYKRAKLLTSLKRTGFQGAPASINARLATKLFYKTVQNKNYLSSNLNIIEHINENSTDKVLEPAALAAAHQKNYDL